MSIDLTGGLDVDREYVFSEPPTTPELREAVNMWVWDDEGRFGLPRFAVEAVAPDWHTHDIHFSCGFTDGRLLRNWSKGPAHPVKGPDGHASRFGAGPLSFETLQPFGRYHVRYDGDALDTSFDNLVRGQVGTGRAAIVLELECEAVAPPFVQGTMSKEAAVMMSSTTEAAFMGGDRFEQLCRVKGRLVVDGQALDFEGGGLRIRRRGVRQISGFWGHCWQSASFPSGRAFGYIAYPPRPSGEPSYNEGFVWSGEGPLRPAKATHAPWLTRLRYSGEDVGSVLQTSDGEARIEAETVISMPTLAQPGLDFPPLVQSIVRYRWDGEEAYGMMERSNLPGNVSIPQ